MQLENGFIICSNMNRLEQNQADIPQIAAFFREWLQAEIIDSDVGRNRVLSEFDRHIDKFFMDFDASDNQASRKTRSHNRRMTGLLELYKDRSFRGYDEVIAKMGHHGLMMVSGAFRTESYLMARSADEYMGYRHTHGPAGVDITGAVREGVMNISGEGDAALDAVLAMAEDANGHNLAVHRSVWEWVHDQDSQSLPLAALDSPPVVAMQEVQRGWLGVVAAHTVVAAELRGDLARVPFYEPRSITDAGMYFPFAAA